MRSPSRATRKIEMILIGRFAKRTYLSSFPKCFSSLLSAVIIPFLALAAWGAVGGSISGTVKDLTGGVIPGATVMVTNVSLRTEFKTMTDARGFFSFPNLAVGNYDLTIECTGFKPQ